MSDATRVLHRFCFVILAVGGLSASALADDHLLLSEVCPSDAYEFIEIYNPLGVPVDLTNYYLSDSPIYCRRPQQIPPVPSPGDFVVQFPLGSSIGPGARKVIALNGTAFATHFGFDADFEFPPGEGDPDGPAANMVGPYPGSLNLPNIGNTGEGLTMFFWNGAAILCRTWTFFGPDSRRQATMCRARRAFRWTARIPTMSRRSTCLRRSRCPR